MDVKLLSKPLEASQLDFRVQSINKGGYATLLAYKNARIDQQVLDEAVGPLNWKREHCLNNHNCIVSIWDEGKEQWVSKEDTGSESSAEKEKGLASDSFKRACFNWGIGRELYNYPVIQVRLSDNEWNLSKEKPKASWGLQLKEWRWFNQFDEQGNITCLAAKDQNNKQRFKWGEYKKETK